MRRLWRLSWALLAAVACGPAANAAIIINDTWQDGTRTDPGSPTYSEFNGTTATDGDADGDLETRWFTSPTAAMSVATGALTLNQQTGSSSLTTYLTPDGSQITLAQGDKLTVTWVFTPQGVGVDANRGLRLALVDTVTAGARRTTDGTPVNAEFTGYRTSLNISQTLVANSIELRERQVLTAENLLTNDDRWTGAIASVGAAGAQGMVNGTQYTYVWSLERTFADELVVNASISGGTFAGTGNLALSFTDTTPNAGSFSFDTFAIRPSSAASTATTLTTSRFMVELTSVPEPSALAAVGVLAAAFAARRRS